MTFASVSTALPLQNGHMVGRVTTSSNPESDMLLSPRLEREAFPTSRPGRSSLDRQGIGPAGHARLCGPAAYWLHLDPCVCSRVNSRWQSALL
jgi:hypothetical protein